MALNEQQIEALEKKGFDQEMLNKYERAIFLLQNESNTLRLEYDEYMKQFGIRGKASELSLKAKTATENYLKGVRNVIPSKENKNFFKTYEKFDKDFRKLAGLQELKTK